MLRSFTMSCGMVRAAQLTAAIAVFAGAAPADADPEPDAPSRVTRFDPKRPVAVDLAATTALPIMVLGAAGTVELPYGILLDTEVGWLGKPYTDAINAVFKAEGAYGTGAAADSAQAIVRSALHNSPVFRAAIGWRPLSDYGLEMYMGYTLVVLRADCGAGELATVTGVTPQADELRADLQMQSLLHNLDLGVGWRWMLGDHTVFRLKLEYLQTLGSSTSASADTGNGSVTLPQLSAALNAHLDPLYLSVRSPLLSVAYGYRF